MARPWTLSELGVLYHGQREGLSVEEIAAKLPGRTPTAVASKLKDPPRDLHMGRNGTVRPDMPRGYSDAELEWARAHPADPEAVLILGHHKDRTA